MSPPPSGHDPDSFRSITRVEMVPVLVRQDAASTPPPIAKIWDPEKKSGKKFVLPT
jgi:hypothetical protein